MERVLCVLPHYLADIRLLTLISKSKASETKLDFQEISLWKRPYFLFECILPLFFLKKETIVLFISSFDTCCWKWWFYFHVCLWFHEMTLTFCLWFHLICEVSKTSPKSQQPVMKFPWEMDRGGQAYLYRETQWCLEMPQRTLGEAPRSFLSLCSELDVAASKNFTHLPQESLAGFEDGHIARSGNWPLII